MEVKRESPEFREPSPIPRCFNPCFDGSEARDAHICSFVSFTTCFNPCFDGSEARALQSDQLRAQASLVSILVLMEVKRERAQSF